MDLDHLPDVAKMKQRLLADRLFDTQLLFVSLPATVSSGSFPLIFPELLTKSISTVWRVTCMFVMAWRRINRGAMCRGLVFCLMIRMLIWAAAAGAGEGTCRCLIRRVG